MVSLNKPEIKKYNRKTREFEGVDWIQLAIGTVQWQSIVNVINFFPWRCGPTRAMASSFFRFLDHTQRRTTVGRTPLDE